MSEFPKRVASWRWMSIDMTMSDGLFNLTVWINVIDGGGPCLSFYGFETRELAVQAACQMLPDLSDNDVLAQLKGNFSGDPALLSYEDGEIVYPDELNWWIENGREKRAKSEAQKKARAAERRAAKKAKVEADRQWDEQEGWFDLGLA